MSWDVPPVLYNGGATIDEYEIRYEDQDDHVLVAIAEGESTSSKKLEELMPGTLYNIEVRAHNDSGVDVGNGPGWGEWSDIVQHPTTEPEEINEPPTVDIQIDGNSVSEYNIGADDTVRIDTVVTDDAPIDELTFSWSGVNVNDADQNYQDWTPPEDSGYYDISVTVEDAGTPIFTATDSVVMIVTTVPDKVTGVAVSNVPDSHTELLVSWDVPPILHNGGVMIDMYEVRYIPHPSDNALIAIVEDESTSSKKLEELMPGTFYNIQVRAHNDSGVDVGNGPGWGEWSDIVQHPTTADTVPDKVTGVEVDDVPESYTELLVSWDVPPVLYNGGATIDEYEIRYEDQDDHVLVAIAEGESTSSKKLEELMPGTLYNIEVRAHNDSGVDVGNGPGWGEWSDIVQHPTPTPPPELIPPSITSFVANQYETEPEGTLIFTAEAIDPDGDVSKLTFDFTAEAGGFAEQSTSSDLEQATSEITWTAPAVIPEEVVTYKVNVMVTDEDGLTAHTGDDAEAQRPPLVVTVRIFCTEPDRPNAPIVTLTSATSIRVEWTAPADNGCAITDYDLRYRIRHDPGDAPNEWISYLLSDDTWLPVNSEDNGFETVLSMLPNAIHYEVQIRAENRSGESDWSPSGYIENTPPRITIASDVSVIALSGSNNLPTAAMITVTIEDDEDDIADLILTFNTMELTGTGTNRTFSHPSTNADYEIQATVEDSGGLTASASVVISAIDVPDAPNRPEVTLNDLSSIEVRWSEPESNNSEITDYDVRYKLVSDVAERYEEWLPDDPPPIETFSDRRALITGSRIQTLLTIMSK